jgi:iron-sulfur cluster assembly protein
MSFPITVTERALKEVKRLLSKENTSGAFLRLGVKGGGCSGLEYLMKIDSEPRQNDLTVELDGVLVACDAKSAKLLEGASFDYTGNLIGGGFKFNNPNAARSCGCGTSFTPKSVQG